MKWRGSKCRNTCQRIILLLLLLIIVVVVVVWLKCECGCRSEYRIAVNYE